MKKGPVFLTYSVYTMCIVAYMLTFIFYHSPLHGSNNMRKNKKGIQISYAAFSLSADFQMSTKQHLM